MLIAYIHGFLSGPNAVKSTILKNYLKDRAPDIKFCAPDFPDTPYEAYAFLVDYFKDKSEKYEDICLVGSSMGGFFSTVLAHKFKFKAALLNPCVHPQDFFVNLIGEHYNESTGRHFELKGDMLDFLCSLDKKCIAEKDLLYVLLQQGDEVLDYKRAVEFYDGCLMDITSGGCHTFDDFESKIPSILEFFSKKTI